MILRQRLLNLVSRRRAALSQIATMPQDDFVIPAEVEIAELPDVVEPAEAPGAELVLAVVEAEITGIVDEIAPAPRVDHSIVARFANVNGQMIDYLEARDATLSKQIVDLAEEQRQVRAVLGIFTGNRAAFGTARQPKRRASRAATPKSRAAAE